MSGILFQNTFQVNDVDPEGKKFDRVSRFHCEGLSSKLDLVLDVNTWVFPMELGNKFSLALATTLKMDEDQNKGDPQKARTVSLDDSFEYVMYGRVYRIQGDDGSPSETSARLSVYASYGGLMMQICGDAKNLHGFELDQEIYLLIKKLA